MEHQDWTPVILTKNPQKNYTQKELEEHQKKQEEKLKKKAEEDNEVKAPPKVSNELKKSLQQARISKKMSQKDLATKLNVPTKTITDYENGKIVPNNQFISKMEKILNVKLPRIKKN